MRKKVAILLRKLRHARNRFSAWQIGVVPYIPDPFSVSVHEAIVSSIRRYQRQHRRDLQILSDDGKWITVGDRGKILMTFALIRTGRLTRVTCRSLVRGRQRSREFSYHCKEDGDVVSGPDLSVDIREPLEYYYRTLSASSYA